jgi:hypothetical protein
MKTGAKYKHLQSELQQFGLGLREPRYTYSRLVGDKFGKYHVDTKQLGQGVLEVLDDRGNLQLKTPVSQGLRYLMQHPACKRRAGRDFTAADLDAYHRLAEMSSIKLDRKNRRRVLAEQDGEGIHFLQNDPAKLVDRMQLLVGEIGAGNTSKEVKNEAMSIADILLRQRHLSKAEHKRIFDEILHASS